MKIIPHWKPCTNWHLELFSVFCSDDFWGFCLLGHTFEFPRTEAARSAHKNS